jgi:hypothetical protein
VDIIFEMKRAKEEMQVPTSDTGDLGIDGTVVIRTLQHIWSPWGHGRDVGRGATSGEVWLMLLLLVMKRRCVDTELGSKSLR